MQVKVFSTPTGWRADPAQLSGMPPNGTGQTPAEAVADLVRLLGSIRIGDPDAGYLRQMAQHGWPMLEIYDGDTLENYPENLG